jgi:hypothetical protein
MSTKKRKAETPLERQLMDDRIPGKLIAQPVAKFHPHLVSSTSTLAQILQGSANEKLSAAPAELKLVPISKPGSQLEEFMQKENLDSCRFPPPHASSSHKWRNGYNYERVAFPIRFKPACRSATRTDMAHTEFALPWSSSSRRDLSCRQFILSLKLPVLGILGDGRVSNIYVYGRELVNEVGCVHKPAKQQQQWWWFYSYQGSLWRTPEAVMLVVEQEGKIAVDYDATWIAAIGWRPVKCKRGDKMVVKKFAIVLTQGFPEYWLYEPRNFTEFEKANGLIRTPL